MTTWAPSWATPDVSLPEVVRVCLATEVDDQQLRATFLEIASGVTLLERRTDGRAPLVETIMLAVT